MHTDVTRPQWNFRTVQCTGCANKNSPIKIMYFSKGGADLRQTVRVCM